MLLPSSDILIRFEENDYRIDGGAAIGRHLVAAITGCTSTAFVGCAVVAEFSGIDVASVWGPATLLLTGFLILLPTVYSAVAIICPAAASV